MKKVIAYVHSHWDREWYREFEDFRLRLIEVFDKVIEDLDSKQIPAFYFDGQTAAIDDYLEIFPQKLEKVKQLIKDKKLFVGPFYCSSDSFLTSAESFIRNLCIGIKRSKELGCSDYIGYLSDAFGHSKSVPALLKSFGIDKAILWRGLGNLQADLEWDGIAATYLIQGYFQDFLNLNVSLKDKAKFLTCYLDKIAARSTDTILLPIGADHLATPFDLESQIKGINKYLVGYEIELKTPFEYFKEIKNSDRKKVSGEFLDNSTNFILPGVYSSRIYLKQENANLQWQLTRISEPLQAFCNLVFGKDNRQNQIDYAYKTLIQNHAHDSIYGCSVDAVHQEMMTRFEKVRSVSNGIIKRCIRDLTTATNELSVINLSNYEYSGLVKIRTHKELSCDCDAVVISKENFFTDEKIYDIQQIPVTEDITEIKEYLVDVKNIPAFSMKKITKEDIFTEKYLVTSENSIENNNIKLSVENNKVVITDKQKNVLYKDFINIVDRADIGDSYNFGALKNDKALKAVIKSVKLVESNDKRAILRMQYEIKIPASSADNGRSKKEVSHQIALNAILSNQSQLIEFEADWINKSENHILQIEFNLAEPITKTLNEDALGVVAREFNPDYDIYKKIPAPKGIELKPNTSVFQRFVWTQGFGLVTEGLNEYEVHKNKLRLTILRAVGVISNHKNPTRGTPAGPPLATPDLQCIGQNKARFAFAFKENSDEMFRLAEEFYISQMPLFSCECSCNLLKINNDKVLAYAVKLSEDGLVVRLFNTSNKVQTINLYSDVKFDKIFEVSPLQEVKAEIASKIEFQPNELKTIMLIK